MKITLNTPGLIDGRNFTGAIESSLQIRDRLRTTVTFNDVQFRLNSVAGSIMLEQALDGQKALGKIEVEIPDDAECDVEEIRDALQATLALLH